MNAINDLKALEQMLKEIVWAPNRAIATMMRREAELFARRLAVFSSDSDDTKLYRALDFAVKASDPRAEQEALKRDMVSNWAEYESAVSQRTADFGQVSEVS